jgi:hypothetical protein
MFHRVATKDPTAVEMEVQSVYLAMFPRGDKWFVPQVFGWAIDSFTGRYADYQPIDAGYHDFEHTLQGTLCLVRLLRGRHRAGARPRLTPKFFQLGLLAILFHDSGYLKRKGDVKGTGAKYTVVHVERGAQFAAELLRKKRFRTGDIKTVRNVILCTGANADLNKIPFQGELEKVVGCSVGTADLLGQMAAEDYVDKLPMLYDEFAEAAHHQRERSGLARMFSSATDLMRKTPAFWEEYVQRKLTQDFGGLYLFLNQPYPSGPNYYLQSIETNMKRLRRKLDKSGALVG